jgi:hypothetical protein
LERDIATRLSEMRILNSRSQTSMSRMRYVFQCKITGRWYPWIVCCEEGHKRVQVLGSSRVAHPAGWEFGAQGDRHRPWHCRNHKPSRTHPTPHPTPRTLKDGDDPHIKISKKDKKKTNSRFSTLYTSPVVLSK